jgi:hypothetical protein
MSDTGIEPGKRNIWTGIYYSRFTATFTGRNILWAGIILSHPLLYDFGYERGTHYTLLHINRSNLTCYVISSSRVESQMQLYIFDSTNPTKLASNTRPLLPLNFTSITFHSSLQFVNGNLNKLSPQSGPDTCMQAEIKA